MSSQRLIIVLVLSNVIALQLGALTPQPPSPLNSAVAILLVLFLMSGAIVAGKRQRTHWFRDAIRDVVVGQGLGWTLGLAVVGFWHGGLSSPRWLAAFAPIFLLGCVTLTLLFAPMGHWLARKGNDASDLSPPAS